MSRWYLGWKKIFSADLVAKDIIRSQFHHALQMINQSLSGQSKVVYTPAPAPVPPPASSTPLPTPSSSSLPPPPKLSFKEVVERFAEENNTVFLPTQKRTSDGKQIYLFGSCPVLIEQQLLLRQVGTEWKPCSLDELLNYI